MTENKKHPVSRPAYELLGMETALLISTAPSRNVDVSIWFNEKSNQGRLPQNEFDSKLLSLASTMGIGQDVETKRELELAVSPLALRMVHSLCTVGEDEFRQPLIDVTYFFRLSEERVSHYLMEMEAAEREALQEMKQVQQKSHPESKQQAAVPEQNFRNWEAGEYDIQGNLVKADASSNPNAGTYSRQREEGDDHEGEEHEFAHEEEFDESKEMAPEEKIQILYQNNFQRHVSEFISTSLQQHEDDDDFVHVSAEEYIRDIREKAAAPRPKSAPSGKRGAERGESTEQTLQFSKDDQYIPVKSAAHAIGKTAEPYDEEFAFAAHDSHGNEDDDMDTAEYVKSRENQQSNSKSGPNKKKKPQPFDIEVTNIPLPKKTAEPSNSTKLLQEKRASTTMAKDWHEENRVFLMVSGASKQHSAATRGKDTIGFDSKNSNSYNASSKLPKPRPSSADPRIRFNNGNRSNTPNRQVSSTAKSSPGSNKKSSNVTPSTVKSSSAKDLRSKSVDRGLGRASTRQQRAEDNEDQWRRELKDDPVAFIFPKASIKEVVDPKRRNSFGGFGRSVLNGSILKPRSQPVFHSTSQLKPSQLTEEEINHAKDIVEDIIRNLVKKTDLYHRLQVSFGYVEDYTLIPPRGEIIQSKRKEWLTDRDIHTGFLSSRLFLNQQQIWMLKRLVVDFSEVYRKSYQEKIAKMIKLTEEFEEILPKSVKGPGNVLNNEWLKKYLVHLRLTKRNHSNQLNINNPQTEKDITEIIEKTIEVEGPPPLSSSNIPHSAEKITQPSSSNANTREEHETGGNDQEKSHPVPWKEWLAKKLQAEMSKGPLKPKEFLKILSGNVNTTLSKEEMELYVKNHSIVPEEALLQEIEYRIEGWILDMDGRRDFQHQLNIKLRTYIWEELIMKPSSSGTPKIPPTEKQYWKLYYQLPAEDKEKIKSSIITQLINEKRETLKSSERITKEITKSLFWNYFQSVKDRGTTDWTWNQWIIDHLEKYSKNLEKYKNEKLLQKQQLQHQQSRKRALAPLITLEKSLKSISNHLDHYHQIQLQKGIIHLRKLAKEKGIGKGEVVTKEDFDHHIKTILTPYISLNETILVEDQENLDHKFQSNVVAKEWKEKISKLFTLNSEETLQQVLQDHEFEDQKNKISYEKWAAEKNRLRQEKEKEATKAKEAKAREEEIKKKNSDKAYKKWLRLRDKNKYKSMVDNKYHELPVRRVVDHQTRWLSHESAVAAAREAARGSLLHNASFDEQQTSNSSPRHSTTTGSHWNHDDKPLPRPASRKKSADNNENIKERSESAGKRRFSVTHLNTKSNLAGNLKAINNKHAPSQR